MTVVTVAVVALTSACANGSNESSGATTPTTQRVVSDAVASCTALSGFELDASRIALPTSGAHLTEATIAKSPVEERDYCQVTGAIDAVDPAAPPIRFQVNLPVEWNGTTVQMGGGGYNGTVVTGLDNVPGTGDADPDASDASPSTDVPLPPIDQGYVTFGSDGGTDVGENAPGSFALNPTALANYAGESVKRTRDAAIAVVEQFYGSTPDLQFHVGGSKGGHESLVAAQRYPDDYDGVIAYYPAAQNQAFVAGWSGMVDVAYDVPGNYLDPEHRQFVTDAVIGACDDLDGIEDGIVSDVRGCSESFDVSTLLCDSTSTPCLTPAQADEITFASEPQRLPYPLANGVDTVGPYPVLAGADLSIWMTDEDTSNYDRFVEGVQKYFIAQDSTENPVEFDYMKYRDRVEAFSQQFDATSTDLDSFVDKGGKLILVQGDTDMLVPQQATSNYYENLVSKYGRSDLDQSVKYYTVPGYGHGNGEFDLVWDSLGALQTWVADGVAPTEQIARENGDRARPLCEYPGWPRYTGTGPANEAGSFECATTP
ncbi:hypothetical protein A3K89_14710 [Rhodococcoides kyotonense]|uniref:Feruloyl esterase n=1 Tax=Rhodococcoides kyotonense TaxID=398843 RepID=A0A177YMP4_9NOCA|nr:hypothetical protein A3K89_14710 [Rhodococcus kyotonensis]